MSKTIQGSLDGETVQLLEVGSAYETVSGPCGDRLARYHIKQGAAVAAPTMSLSKPPKRKASK